MTTDPTTDRPTSDKSPDYNRGWADGNAAALDACNPVIERLQAALATPDSRASDHGTAAGGDPMTDRPEPRARATFLVQSDFDRLEDWCRMVRAIFGRSFGPYLVGSATERADYRDVDIRVLMRDEDFDLVFRRRPEVVRFLNRALSVWGQQETGLPIDFQVQRQTEANAEFTGPRNAMGVRDWALIPTSGVPR